MEEDVQTAGFMDAVRLNRLLDGGAIADTDAKAILSVLNLDGHASAAAAMALYSGRPPLGQEESQLVAGIPADGRRTRCCVIEGGPGEAAFASVWFDVEALTRQALALFEAEPGEAPVVAMGCPVPTEVSSRLVEARRRPALARHLSRSAADHMSACIIGLLRELPGVAERGEGLIWTARFPRERVKEALAWLSEPGPGAFASSVFVFMPEGGAK